MLPRGTPVFDALGQPVYSERDNVDLGSFRSLGYPFWLAGSMASPQRVAEALAEGATGVQVGTLFAYARESGMHSTLRQQVYEHVVSNDAVVATDPLASSTGFPFKVVDLDGTMAKEAAYAKRERICDLGYLREAYATEKGSVAYRCAAEPVEHYLLHGGTSEATVGRKCLCNGLFAAIGLGQHRASGEELPIVTSGDEISAIGSLAQHYGFPYSALDVVHYLAPSH